MAASVASRPRAIRMRPMRGLLWRASTVCQAPPRKTSNQALKSIGDGSARHADIAQIAGAIARRDIHAAAERDRQMGEVAADAFALGIAFRRGAVGAGMLDSRTGCGHGCSRGWPAPAASPARSCRTAPRPRSPAGRCRNSGCPEDRSARSSGSSFTGACLAPQGRCPARRCRGCARGWTVCSTPAGATSRVQRLPKPSI